MLHRPNLPGRAWRRSGPPYGGEIRRLALALLLSTLLALAAAPLAGASMHAPERSSATSTTVGRNTDEHLPRTDLEAEQRDNGHTSQAPYILWSGLVSVVVVVVGGLLFKRRFDREN